MTRYRYVNDHGALFRMTETRYRRYLLAGTCADKVPEPAEYGVNIGTALTVNKLTPSDFSDEYNHEARLADAPKSNSLASEKVALRWISWEQHGDAEHDPNCRSVAWPPPAEVLAFWETGRGGDEGVDAYCTVVALVRAPSESAATEIIKKAWSPGIGEWRFNREYGKDVPPGDRFPPPSWSIKMGRWPWSKRKAKKEPPP